MNPAHGMNHPKLDRRTLLGRAGLGIVAATAPRSFAAGALSQEEDGGLHHAPRAKRVVQLFMSGGPSQIDLFDHKPLLQERNGEELPDSVRRGQRLTGMSGNQASLPLAGTLFKFAKHGECGAEISELLPYTAKIADDLCIVRTLVTDAINHDPAATFALTGSQIAGRPSLGAWLSYGLGSLNRNLPEFVSLVTQGRPGQPLYDRLWGSGFLSSRHAGVQLRAGADPVLFLNDPPGIDRKVRRRMLDALRRTAEDSAERTGSSAPLDRVAQAELAFRMQESIPEVADVSDEPASTFDLYGEDAKKPGTFAANCLLARRLLERDVRFVQLFHQGWDQHGGLPGAIRVQCKDTDRASAALVTDLKARGLLDDTLVVWGGEFGRTCYSQGKLTARPTTAAITTHAARPCGWPEGARTLVSPTARPTTSATTSTPTRSTSTTSTQRSCTSSASTTSASPTATRAGATDSPTCTGTWCAR